MQLADILSISGAAGKKKKYSSSRKSTPYK
jgi:hypothetical protein